MHDEKDAKSDHENASESDQLEERLKCLTKDSENNDLSSVKRKKQKLRKDKSDGDPETPSAVKKRDSLPESRKKVFHIFVCLFVSPMLDNIFIQILSFDFSQRSEEKRSNVQNIETIKTHFIS